MVLDCWLKENPKKFEEVPLVLLWVCLPFSGVKDLSVNIENKRISLLNEKLKYHFFCSCTYFTVHLFHFLVYCFSAEWNYNNLFCIFEYFSVLPCSFTRKTPKNLIAIIISIWSSKITLILTEHKDKLEWKHCVTGTEWHKNGVKTLSQLTEN